MKTTAHDLIRQQYGFQPGLSDAIIEYNRTLYGQLMKGNNRPFSHIMSICIHVTTAVYYGHAPESLTLQSPIDHTGPQQSDKCLPEHYLLGNPGKNE